MIELGFSGRQTYSHKLIALIWVLPYYSILSCLHAFYCVIHLRYILLGLCHLTGLAQCGVSATRTPLCALAFHSYPPSVETDGLCAWHVCGIRVLPAGIAFFVVGGEGRGGLRSKHTQKSRSHHLSAPALGEHRSCRILPRCAATSVDEQALRYSVEFFRKKVFPLDVSCCWQSSNDYWIIHLRVSADFFLQAISCHTVRLHHYFTSFSLLLTLLCYKDGTVINSDCTVAYRYIDHVMNLVYSSSLG